MMRPPVNEARPAPANVEHRSSVISLWLVKWGDEARRGRRIGVPFHKSEI